MGSSNYITNFDGEVSQHMEYIAFGETFIEEHKNSNNSPYKFNSKELDDESGLYYYGARYYDPRISIWASIDPLAEKFLNQSPYNYCFNNPVRLVDPDGRSPENDIRINTKTNETSVVKTNDKFDRVFKDGKYVGTTQKGYAESVFKAQGKFMKDSSNPNIVGMGAVDGAIAFLAAELIGAAAGLAKVGSLLNSAVSSTAGKVAVNATADITVNATTQFIANGGKGGEINMVEAASSAIPGGKTILGQLVPVVVGETFSLTAKKGFETPNSFEKWGAQVGGGILSYGFGKATDNHLAGEKGGAVVGGFFKAVVETGSNAAPNLIK